MPITQAQANLNQELLNRAHSNPVKARMTGKLLKLNPETGDLETDPNGKIQDKQKNIRWGWMGKVFGPDEKGYIRELVGAKFGQGIPREGFEYHTRYMKTQGTCEFKFEVIDEDSSPAGSVPDKSMDEMTKNELIELAVGKGLGEAKKLVTKNKDELIELLS